MDDREAARLAHQRDRWMKPNWRLWVRHDVERFLPPKPRECKYSSDQRYVSIGDPYDTPSSASAAAAERSHLAALRFQLALIRLELVRRKALHPSNFNPNQPRVPAGVREGGQWVRLAGNDTPGKRPGSGTMMTIGSEVARRAIEIYRSDRGLRDLFGGRVGTVTHATINGKDVFGENSTSSSYDIVDGKAAVRLRDALLEKYPDVMKTENAGQKPNDAVFHAEATILLRAARENGGTLEGQTIEVHSDRPMCGSCRLVLPYIGLEVGNPTVTFVNPSGLRQTMQNGAWVR